MSFLYPAFLIGAVAVAIPIVLHFLRRDVAPDVPFSAVRLLQRSPVERSRRRRLRDMLLLAARVAALVLLAAAFARPFVAGASGQVPPLRVIAIDRSYSMGAPGRFAQALALARRSIDEAGLSEPVAVIAFDDRADVIGSPGPAAAARASLAGLQPGFGATRFGPLFVKALELADGSPGRLIVVSDLQRAGWEDEQRPVLPSTWQVSVLDAGAPPANLAVAAVRVETDRLVAAVRNSGREPQTCRITVTREGRVVATLSAAAGGDRTTEVTIPYRSPAEGSLAVSVEDPNGFAADNTRFVVLDPVSREAVRILTTPGAERSGFYMLQALQTAVDEPDGRRAFDTRRVPGAALSVDPERELAHASAIVVLSTRGTDRPAREALASFVRRGGGAFIAAGPDVEPDVLATMFGWKTLGPVDRASKAVTLSATDLRHPIFRPFGSLAANLGQVRFERAWHVRPEGWDVAARFTDGTPALLDRREGEGRVVLFASDVDRRWNDFPLSPSFVPFTLEAIHYVAVTHERARDYVVGRAPSGAEQRPGVYRLQPDNRSVSVNVDPRESGSSSVGAAEFASMIDRVTVPAEAASDARARQSEARQSFWRYGLLLMLAVLIGESFVGRA
jgi:hypothetical protein